MRRCGDASPEQGERSTGTAQICHSPSLGRAAVRPVRPDGVDSSCSTRRRNAPYYSCYRLLMRGATQCRFQQSASIRPKTSFRSFVCLLGLIRNRDPPPAKGGFDARRARATRGAQASYSHASWRRERFFRAQSRSRSGSSSGSYVDGGEASSLLPQLSCNLDRVRTFPTSSLV